MSKRNQDSVAVREIVGGLLNQRIITDEILNGFSVRGVVGAGMICGDCGDGDCECSS